MTDWSAAVHATAEGVVLDVEVVPGASQDGFPSGYNIWRKRIEARVAAPPTDGRANAGLVVLVAARLRVPARAVSVVGGATSRQKRLLVVGLDRAEVLARLG